MKQVNEHIKNNICITKSEPETEEECNQICCEDCSLFETDKCFSDWKEETND